MTDEPKPYDGSGIYVDGENVTFLPGFETDKFYGDDHIFHLQGYGSPSEASFYCGTIADGRQIIMGWYYEHVVTYFFTPEGEFAGGTRKSWEPPSRKKGEADWQYDRRCEPVVDKLIKDWQAELGFTWGTIRIKRFFDPEYDIGIEDAPGHLQVLDREEDEIRRNELKEMLSGWLEDGEYVFWWGKDYYTGADGSNSST